jgi:CMP-N,N'-diacetyllegionaminic acid synthase
MNIVGIIPARGGSKGVKNKNILDLCGKPVIGYAIEAALNASSLDKVVVSTDSEKIASVVRKLYDVEVIMRPVELAKDDSPIEEALLHAVEYLRENQNYNSDIVAWMQANVPIRQDGIIDVVVNKLINSDADSCVTCYEIEQMPEWMNIINEKERLELISKDIGAIRRQ